MSTALIRPAGSIFWELRGAWASGQRISLSLERGEDRIEGHVTSVAPTNAFVKVGGTHVPGDTILAVHNPSRLGDSTFRDGVKGQGWRGIPRRREPPQKEQLPGLSDARQ